MKSLDATVRFTRYGETLDPLSVRAAGFPLLINGLRIPTCDHLFHALKFPDHPDVQREILISTTECGASTTASRAPHQKKLRPDWEDIQLDVMSYCLRAKLVWNWVSFGKDLRAAAGSTILENSSKTDRYLGVVPDKQNGGWVGENHLGKLLMELRDIYLSEDNSSLRVLGAPPLGLKLGGELLGVVDRRHHLLQVGTRRTAEVELLRT